MKSIKVPVFSVKQEIGDFYSGVIRADQLLAVCSFDYRRMHYSGGYIDFLGIQRKLDEGRIKDIIKYVGTADASFPTSIVVSVDENCAEISETGLEGFKTLTIKEFVNGEQPELNIPLDQSTTIIDGQHRLKGLERAGKGDFELAISIFVGADDATEAALFSIVNLAQTKVNKSLVYDLFALAKNRSPEKTCHEIVVALDRLDNSPFKGRIKRLGTATEGRFGETLSQATIVKGILPYITDDPLLDRDRGKRLGYWEPALAKDFKKRIFYEFFRKGEDSKILAVLINYFNAVKAKWSDAWGSTGNIFILNRTNGYNGLIRFLRPAYLAITTEPRVVSQEEFASVLSSVSLKNEDFTIANFVPGTGGSAKLYRTLLEQSGISAP